MFVNVNTYRQPSKIWPDCAQPNLRKMIDNYAYRYQVLAPIPIRTLVLLTPSSLIIISIIIRYIIIIIISFTDSSFSQLSNSTG